jgi:hypothetical protein
LTYKSIHAAIGRETLFPQHKPLQGANVHEYITKHAVSV